MNIASLYGMQLAYPELASTDKFYAGVECEIEACKNVAAHYVDGLFNTTQDGSLRNPHAPGGHGHEFISIPSETDELIDGFEKLHSKLVYYPELDPFSSRTSVHVHVNCLSLTKEQAKNIVMLYALFEEFFFCMVKPQRRDNIHCVPLSETTLPLYYKSDIEWLSGHWHKYAALNLKRLSDLGTMEFRHMHGTNNVMEFSMWLKTLRNLWTTARDVKLTPDTLRNKELVQKWFEEVFKDAPKILQLKNNLFDIAADSWIDVRFAFIK